MPIIVCLLNFKGYQKFLPPADFYENLYRFHDRVYIREIGVESQIFESYRFGLIVFNHTYTHTNHDYKPDYKFKFSISNLLKIIQIRNADNSLKLWDKKGI